jgi:hypothetical protein
MNFTRGSDANSISDRFGPHNNNLHCWGGGSPDFPIHGPLLWVLSPMISELSIHYSEEVRGSTHILHLPKSQGFVSFQSDTRKKGFNITSLASSVKFL